MSQREQLIKNESISPENLNTLNIENLTLKESEEPKVEKEDTREISLPEYERVRVVGQGKLLKMIIIKKKNYAFLV